MARVIEGNHKGTIGRLTFYEMDGKLYVRTKSSLTARRMKKDPRFAGTRQSANELARASKLASAVYRTLREMEKQGQKLLYKRLVGVAKKALADGCSEERCRELMRAYLHNAGVVKKKLQKRVVQRKRLWVAMLPFAVIRPEKNRRKKGGGSGKMRGRKCLDKTVRSGPRLGDSAVDCCLRLKKQAIVRELCADQQLNTNNSARQLTHLVRIGLVLILKCYRDVLLV